MISGGLRSALIWSFVQTAMRFVLGFASIKVTAVVLGPAGLALVGQLSNVVSLVQGVLGNAIQTAVVKETAREQAAGRAPPLAVWGTAARWLMVVAAAASVVMLLASVPLARWLFDRDDLAWAVVAAAAAMPMALMFQWVQAVLNGQQNYRLVAITQMASGLLGAVIFIGLSYAFGLAGALLGTTLAIASSFLVALVCVRAAGLHEVAQSLHYYLPRLLRPMLGHYPMLIVRSAAAPLAALLVRRLLIDHAGVDQAGIWQAASRLTDMYTQVLITALSMYVMPTLSGIRDAGRFRAAVFTMSVRAAAVVCAMALGIYLGRDWIVAVVFSPAFGKVGDLLGYMLLGDVFQMATWPLRAALVVQFRTFSYMAVEAGAALCQVATTYVLLADHGLQAAPMAYCGTWLAVLVVVALLQARRSTGAP